MNTTSSLHTRSSDPANDVVDHTRIDNEPAAGGNAISDVITKIGDLVNEAEGLLANAGDTDLEGDDKKRFDQITNDLEALTKRKSQLELLARHATASSGPTGQTQRTGESGQPTRIGTAPNINRNADPFDMNDTRFRGPDVKARARTAVEQTRGMADADKETVTRLLDRADTHDGAISRHYVVTANPHYRSAFMKIAADQQWALTNDEKLAVQEVRAGSLADAAGGFAVPSPIDPTLILTNDGTSNPFRQLSRVIPITSSEWKGVTSAGVTASWDGEAGQVSDDAPTLDQPVIKAEKAQAFVPFSIELGGDWMNIEGELSTAFADAKDNLEGNAFAVGGGVAMNRPAGLINTVAGTPASIVQSISAGEIQPEDVFNLQSKTPPRHRKNGISTFMGSMETINRLRSLRSGDGVLVFPYDATIEGMPSIAGRPFLECSDMAAPDTAGNWPLIHGNFSRYIIVDRVGMSIELVPHLMGADGRPTGERGMYAHWRVGGAPVDTNAFRLLEIAA